MRDPDSLHGGQVMQSPSRLYERLAQLSGYTWDQSIQPFHSVSRTRLVDDFLTNMLGPRLTMTGISSVLSIGSMITQLGPRSRGLQEQTRPRAPPV